MNLWNYLILLIIMGIISGHITHIVVTGYIFEGMRQKCKRLGDERGGFWEYFYKGLTCQLCSGVWFAAFISLWWTTALFILRPSLWDVLAERPLGWMKPLAWFSLFLVQMFFLAAVGHLFREIVGLVEDRRTHEEEESEVLERRLERMNHQE